MISAIPKTFVGFVRSQLTSTGSLVRCLATQTQSQSSAYRYTLDGGILNKEQRDFYEENGYMIVKKVVSPLELELYINRFNDYASGKLRPSKELLLQKELAVKSGPINENTLYKIGELYADEVLFSYCRHPKILDLVESFVGKNIMAIHTMLINKPPDTGNKSSRHPLHQDLHYFPMRPASRIVCAWTAMERITRDNGCLSVIAGTHKGAHLEHDYPDWEGGVNKFYYGIKDLSIKDARVHLEMDAGDTVFFHPLLIHGSSINRTNGFRKAISCHYAPAEATFIDVRGTIQEKLANEVMTTMLKKFGTIEIEMDYATLWKLRARSVRGTGSYEL